MKVIEETKREHNEIRMVLMSLAKMCQNMGLGKEVYWQDLSDIMFFIRYYIIEYHNPKEEQLCLPNFKMLGLVTDNDSNNLCSTHKASKEHLDEMLESINGFGEENKKKFIASAKKYIELVIPHTHEIDKLIELASEKNIPNEKQEEMVKKFLEFRAGAIGYTQYEKFSEIATNLRVKYL